MSTYWRFVCLDHEPNIPSDNCGNHDTGLATMRDRYRRRPELLLALEVLDGLDFDTWNIDAGDHYARTTLWFFRQHPRCKMRARSEYGDDADLTPEATQ